MTQAKLAIDGGQPVRSKTLPYGRQSIDDEDIAAVVAALKSDFLTTGPRVGELEKELCAVTGAKHAVAIANGTAALHAAMHALGVGPGDEVIVPAMTFAASSNAAVYMGARPVFCDVDPLSLLIDAKDAAARRTSKTKAVVAVDYAGAPCDVRALRAAMPGVPVVSDACHALGGRDEHGGSAGTLGDLSTFSFHPVKSVTTGEGGAITTDDEKLAQRMRVFRNHGITTDHRQRELAASFFYEMVELGFNYRLSDMQCALGVSQLKKLPRWLERRQEIVDRYRKKLVEVPAAEPLHQREGTTSGNHLFVVQLHLDRLRVDRDQVFRAMRAEGIGVNVHYIPVHMHPFYRERFGTKAGTLPVSENAYRRILTLPLFPAMSDADVDDVVAALQKVLEVYAA